MLHPTTVRRRLRRATAAVAACLTISIAGCAQQGADGYQFDDMEFERPTPNITVVMHPSLANLRADAPAVAIEQGRNLYAWSYLTRDACEIHVVDPRVAYQPEWIGHEAAHCIWGRWHP